MTGGGPADMDTLSVGLFDDANVYIGQLTNVDSVTWQHELSAPGALSCRVAEDDPLYADLLPKRILKVFWRGAPRMAARIDSSSVDLAVDGRRWREFQALPGCLQMLADGIVYPEYGKDHSASGQRWFGYMSKTGAWHASGNWSAAEGYDYNSDVTNKAGKPEGLSFPDPWWIAKNGPTFVEVGGQVQHFRRAFTTTSTLTYQILATADDFLTLWLDGEKLYESDQQTSKEWRFLQQITGTIATGDHQLAAQVVNARGFVDNPMALIATLQEVDSTGNVVGTPVVNTDDSWEIADNHPGFRRGDVLATVFEEAAARSVAAFGVLSLGFTHTQDTNAVDWADDPGEYALDVKSTVLDAVTQLTEKALDVDMDFDTLAVNAFNRLGSNLSGTVALQVGVSLKAHRIDRVEAKFNTTLVQKADGSYTEAADSTSVGTYGRIETGIELGSTSDNGTVTAVAAGAFTESANTAYTFTSTLSTLAGPQLYVDYNLGDTITVPDDAGSTKKVRVMAATVDASGEVPVITPEFSIDRSA